MKSLNPFRRSKGRKTEVNELRLQALRFRVLLENARMINDLYADGVEKIRGDYIFDRHYVVSLADMVLERMGMIVFDACVLVPKGGSTLYQLYDEQKKIARQCFLNEGDLASKEEVAHLGIDFPDDLEFGLLASVLSWMNGRPGGKFLSVMEFFKLIFDHVIRGLDEKGFPESGFHLLRVNWKGIENQFLIVDQGRGVMGDENVELSLRDLNCRPLGLMFVGADYQTLGLESAQKATARKWFAVVSDEHLGLQSADSHGGVRLEVTLSGDVESDFIFIFTKNPTDPEEFVPEGCRIERTKMGAACWIYDVPSTKIENDLIHLGRWLFGTAEL
jgi:hypothetical protein